MNNLLKKLRSKAGESLVETLAAILIFTMASIVMYSMVTTAADLNRKAKETDQAVQSQMTAIEKGEESAKSGTEKVTFSMNGSTMAEVDVDIYGGNGKLYSYFARKAGG